MSTLVLLALQVLGQAQLAISALAHASAKPFDDPEDLHCEPESECELEHNEAARNNETTTGSNAATPQHNEGSPAPLRISLASLLQPNTMLGSHAHLRISLASLLQPNTLLGSLLETIN